MQGPDYHGEDVGFTEWREGVPPFRVSKDDVIGLCVKGSPRRLVKNRPQKEGRGRGWRPVRRLLESPRLQKTVEGHRGGHAGRQPHSACILKTS